MRRLYHMICMIARPDPRGGAGGRGFLIAESEVTIRMEPCGKDCSFVREKKQCPYLE